MLIFSYLTLACVAAILVGLVWPLTHKWRALLGVGGVLVLLTQYRRAFHLCGLQMVISPDAVPTGVVIALLCIEMAVVLGGVFAGIRIVLGWCGIKRPPYLFILLAVGLGVAMVYLGKAQPTVKPMDVVLRDLPAEAEGLRVAVVSDIHLDQWAGRDWCAQLVETLNAAAPDVVLFTGDQTDGAVALRLDALEPLKALNAPAFTVSGNHEWYFDYEGIMAAYAAVGLRNLDGCTATFRGLTLVGVPDAPKLIDDTNTERLPQLLADVPASACTVLLAHKPALAETADALGVDLQLSGHTHGGQFPGLSQLIAKYNRGYVRGWYRLSEGLQLFVSPGASTWIGFPFRLYPTQIPLLILHSERESL